jgi:hypothetical protein
MNFKTLFLLALFFFDFRVPAFSVDIPSGWSISEIPSNHVEADFNGDGLKDDAWVLSHVDDNVQGLTVWLAQKTGPPIPLQLENNIAWNDLGVGGIFYTSTGTYTTCCAPNNCAFGEEPLVTLKNSGFELMHNEGRKLYFWDPLKKTFRNVCTDLYSGD